MDRKISYETDSKTKKPIMKILYGECGHDYIYMTEETKKAIDAVCAADDKLRANLTDYPDLLELYNDEDDRLMCMHILECDEYYHEGFRFGFMLALDTMKLLK